MQLPVVQPVESSQGTSPAQNGRVRVFMYNSTCTRIFPCNLLKHELWK